MIRERARQGWIFLGGGFVGLMVVGNLAPARREDAGDWAWVISAALVTCIVCMWVGIYSFVKAKGLPGSYVLLGLLGPLGLIILACTKDRAPSASDPGSALPPTPN